MKYVGDFKMSWIAILQLAVALLNQALQAFNTGQKKEMSARVQLSDQHAAVVRHLADQYPEV